ncbi:MAG: hypothetical protein ABR517_14215 [Thermoanaerobaculia bacterium]
MTLFFFGRRVVFFTRAFFAGPFFAVRFAAAGFLAAGLFATTFFAPDFRADRFAALRAVFFAAGRADFFGAAGLFLEAAFLAFAFAGFLETFRDLAGAAFFTALFFLEAFLVAIGSPSPFDACNLDPWQLGCLEMQPTECRRSS